MNIIWHAIKLYLKISFGILLWSFILHNKNSYVTSFGIWSFQNPLYHLNWLIWLFSAVASNFKNAELLTWILVCIQFDIKLIQPWPLCWGRNIRSTFTCCGWSLTIYFTTKVIKILVFWILIKEFRPRVIIIIQPLEIFPKGNWANWSIHSISEFVTVNDVASFSNIFFLFLIQSINGLKLWMVVVIGVWIFVKSFNTILLFLPSILPSCLVLHWILKHVFSSF